MKDMISIDRVNKLHPKARAAFRHFIEEAERSMNIVLRVTSGYRTVAEQAARYAQGRTSPGPIVTLAKPGMSYHNYGLAVDLVEMKGNEPNWKVDYKAIAAIAKRHGIAWGGNFKSITDKPHYELTLGYKVAELRDTAKDRYGYPMI